MRTLLITCLVATSAFAQQPIPAKAFLIDDYKNVAFADLKALRDRGIWADLEVSVLKVVFKQMEKERGFPLTTLDRVTMVADLGEQQEGAEVDVRNIREVLVLEGNGALGMPASVERGSWQQATVGKHTVRRRDMMRPETFAQPCPEMQVSGATDVIEAALDGKPHTGLPCADLMSLLSGRGDNLAYMAFDVDNALLREKALGVLFPGAEWPEGDAPKFVFCRVRATGEADDPHLEIEAVVRHVKAGAGLEASGKAVEAWIERMQKEPSMRAVRPLLQRAEKKVDHTDVVLRADLGRTREAVGHIATLLAPLLSPRAGAAEETTEVLVPAPAPPEKKKAP
jgi:hypothetical protein